MKTLLFSLSLLCACAPLPGAPAAERARPNILFILADDWGWGDLGCHGHPFLKTPAIDKLASQGMEFTQFNVCSPVCSPSRAAVMTGHFPARHSIHQHFADPKHNERCGMPDWLDPGVVLLPRLFKDAGYKTGHFGKWHLTNNGCSGAPLPTEYGYDDAAVFNGPGPQASDADSSAYDKAIAFIRKHKESPFFLNVWMHETHTPHFPKKQFFDAFEHLDEQQQVYAAVVAEGDHGVGRIMQTLDELGLADDTLIVFSSDNGPEATGGRKRAAKNMDPDLENYFEVGAAGTPDRRRPGLFEYYSVGSTGGLKGRKRSLFEGGVRLPFIVRWPGRTQPGTTNDTTVITAVDLLPTFCEAAQIELPRDYRSDGESMVAAFTGNAIIRTRPLFWEWRGSARGDHWPQLAVRDGDWKLIMTHDGLQRELYNIPLDRAEQHNLATNHPAVVETLARKALAWRKTLPEHPPANCISKSRR